MSDALHAVPTNIITGSLGAGKTTLIQKLLEAKPADERWAILVNEFGEVGIDAALFAGDEQAGVHIREVPGGCMCCTSGLPMQIALNQLLAKARPHRLLIEPTGLGHPKEVLQTLREEHYRDVLDVRATLTLADARKTQDARWRAHRTFHDQFSVADIIVATKTDLYENTEREQLATFLKDIAVDNTPLIDNTDVNQLLTLLDEPCGIALPDAHHHHHSQQPTADIDAMVAQQGYAKLRNEGDGFVSFGWVFPATRQFVLSELMGVISGADVERLKGVFITDQGVVAFNLVDGVLSRFELDDAEDSRLEFICADEATSESLAEQLEAVLLQER